MAPQIDTGARSSTDSGAAAQNTSMQVQRKSTNCGSVAQSTSDEDGAGIWLGKAKASAPGAAAAAPAMLAMLAKTPAE